MTLVQKVMMESGLEGSEWMVLVTLAAHADRFRLVKIPVEDVCRMTGMSDRQARRSHASLVEKRFLEVIEKGGGKAKPTQYRVYSSPMLSYPKLETRFIRTDFFNRPQNGSIP